MLKHSLDHLPTSKRDQLAAIVQVIRDAVEVEMIILFGSHARGDWVDDPVGGYFSDYDILVLVRDDATVDDHDLWSTVENKAGRHARKNQPNLIVHTSADVNHQLEQGWYFFTDVKKEGIVLHDAGRHQLAEAVAKTLEQRRVYAQQCFDYYFLQASQFFTHAIEGIERGWNNGGAFMLHQATENYYKCALLVLTAYRPRQHNIQTLGKQCASLHPAFRDVFPRDTPPANHRFKLLKKAYVDARYNMHYRISRSDLEELARNIAVLRERTEAVCTEHIASMTTEPPG